jgi:hypothetical protein
LYSVIEDIISRAIPLWNLTLTPLKAKYLRYHRIQYSDTGREGFDEDEGETEELSQPEPGPFQPPSVPDHMTPSFFDNGELKPEKSVDLKRDYKGLQVIVKLANIHLSRNIFDDTLLYRTNIYVPLPYTTMTASMLLVAALASGNNPVQMMRQISDMPKTTMIG